mgnify:CR=1 FL=1
MDKHGNKSYIASMIFSFPNFTEKAKSGGHEDQKSNLVCYKWGDNSWNKTACFVSISLSPMIKIQENVCPKA